MQVMRQNGELRAELERLQLQHDTALEEANSEINRLRRIIEENFRARTDRGVTNEYQVPGPPPPTPAPSSTAETGAAIVHAATAIINEQTTPFRHRIYRDPLLVPNRSLDVNPGNAYRQKDRMFNYEFPTARCQLTGNNANPEQPLLTQLSACAYYTALECTELLFTWYASNWRTIPVYVSVHHLPGTSLDYPKQVVVHFRDQLQTAYEELRRLVYDKTAQPKTKILGETFRVFDGINNELPVMQNGWPFAKEMTLHYIHSDEIPRGKRDPKKSAMCAWIQRMRATVESRRHRREIGNVEHDTAIRFVAWETIRDKEAGGDVKSNAYNPVEVLESHGELKPYSNTYFDNPMHDAIARALVDHVLNVAGHWVCQTMIKYFPDVRERFVFIMAVEHRTATLIDRTPDRQREQYPERAFMRHLQMALQAPDAARNYVKRVLVPSANREQMIQSTDRWNFGMAIRGIETII